MSQYLRPSSNTIAHLLALATFALIVLLVFGMGRQAHATAPDRQADRMCRANCPITSATLISVSNP